VEAVTECCLTGRVNTQYNVSKMGASTPSPTDMCGVMV